MSNPKFEQTRFTEAQQAKAPLHLSKLSAALLSISLGMSLGVGSVGVAVAATPANGAEPNVTVLNMMERSNSSLASMCFTLSKGQSVLNETSNLSKFIELKNTASGAVINGSPAVDQGLLCISNLKHGTAYELTLKQGLALTSGEKLNADVKVPFTIADATAQIKLPYNIVLPKNDFNSSFSVQTVNQPSFRLSIYKLSQRNLTQLNLHSLLQNELSGWPLRELLHNSAHKVYEKVFNLATNTTINLGGDYRQTPKFADNNESPVPMPVPTPRYGEGAAGAEGAADASVSIDETALKAALTAKLNAEQKNQSINTEIKLSDFMQDADDGMYLVVAADPRLDYDNLDSFYQLNSTALPISAKLMMVTDLGLSTYRSSDGILVNVRSLTTAESLKDVKLELIAQNNEILATATTDKDGTARFSKDVISGKNALTARAIIATSEDGDDIYSLDLQSSSLYLEDNQGAYSYMSDAAKKFDTYAYTDRGIYRAGEEVHYTALVRDSALKAVNLPLTLQIKSNYQNEIFKVLLDKPLMGGYEYSFKLPEGTPHGSYSAVLSLGNQTISTTPFTVGSFVPNQINTAFLNEESSIDQDKPFKLRTKTNFNYGAQASNLDGFFSISLIPDPHPVEASGNAASNEFLKDFHFGPDSRKYSELTQYEQYYNLKTDVEGVLQQDVTFKQDSYPRIAKVSSSVFDTNNQVVSVAKDFRVNYRRPLIGVRLLKEDAQATAVPLNSEGVATAPSGGMTNFALCSYMQDGSAFPQDVRYYIYKEFTDYNYVYENGQWQFVRFTGRNLVTQGDVKVDNQKLNAAAISASLSDGSYVIELESDKSKTIYSFIKGFASSPNANTPDRVALFADKSQYQDGDKATLSFDSPFDGYANLAIGSSGIEEFKTFEVKKGNNTISVDIDKDLYPQGHALLSIFSPLSENKGDASSGVNVIRAVGLCDLNMDLSSHQVTVKTEVASEVKPESQLTLKVKAEGLKPSAVTDAVTDQDDSKSTQDINNPAAGYAKVTLVDNGVLALTGYQAPDPNSVLMQDRAYDVSLYDAYGLLMTNPKQQGQGYGGTAEKAMLSMDNAAAALQAIPFKTVALASKIVPLNANGEADVAFDVPQFSGSLKVMAVAWDDDQTGATNQDVLVRDNAVATLGLPRFLNLGDEVRARLNLHNLKSTDPEFKIDISCSGTLKCSMQHVSNLKPGAREDRYFTIRTAAATNTNPESLGVGTIKVRVMNPDFDVTQNYDLTVTAPRLPMVKNYQNMVKPSEQATLALADDFKSLNAVIVNKGKLPNVNPQAYTAQIDSYGYYNLGDLIASLESKLLYGKELIASASEDEADTNNSQSQSKSNSSNAYTNIAPNLSSYKPYRNEAELNARIQDLIFRILARQNVAGGFISNSGNSGYFNAYATAVLQLAQDKGFAVNPAALSKAYENLRLNCKNFGGDSAAAYANEVLSTQESINQSNLRYALDEGSVKAPVMLAHLALALEQIGDHARASKAIDTAISGLITWQQHNDELAKLKPNDNNRYEILNRISMFNVLPETDIRHDAFVVINACVRLGLNDKLATLMSSIRALQETPDYLSALTMGAMLRANYSVGAAEGDDLGSYLLSAQDMENLLSAKGGNSSSKTHQNAKPEGESVPAEPATAGDAAAAAAAAAALGYTIADGKLNVANNGKSDIFVTTSVLGVSEQDKIVSNKGINVSLNYFNRDGKVTPQSYNFRMNEEILVEVNIIKSVINQSSSLVKVKLPAGFEYVRTATNNDPAFGKLIGQARVHSPEELQVSDDMLVAKCSRYLRDDNMSLFVVLRAAHLGTFMQGEALVQCENSPQIYGTYIGTDPLKISEKK